MKRSLFLILVGVLTCVACGAADTEIEPAGQTQEAIRSGLFSDGFEATALSTRWLVQGLASTHTLAAFEGSRGAKIYATSSIRVTIDTRGQEDVTVEYARRAIGLTGTEQFIAEWSTDGSTWQTLEATQDPTFRKRFFALGDGASNRATVYLRFRTTALFFWTGADIDAVVVSGEPVTPATQQTTLVLVRNDNTGNPVLQYVRGATHFSSGTYTWKPQPLPFVRLTNSNKVVQAPSALLDTAGSQIVVARARIDGANTRMEVVRAGYASMLAESTVQEVAVRSVVPSSPVTLAHLGSDLVLLWSEGSTLLLVRSTNRGATWGSPETLTAPSVPGPYAISQRAGEILVARAVAGSTTTRIEAGIIRTNKTYAALGDVTTTANSTPFVGIGIAENAGNLFVAHTTASTLRVTRWLGFSPSSSTTTTVLTNPTGSAFHSVAIHPSPFGWGLQYVFSYNAPEGLRFGTHGRRSDDGLNYPTNTWAFSGADTSNTGRTDMALTPVPMPWIIKTHDSGSTEDQVANIFIVGEGFTYADRDQFMRAAEVLTLNIESRAPFRFHPERYNVWAVADYSKQRYYDHADFGERDTLFNARNTAGLIVSPRVWASAYFDRLLHSYNFIGTPPRTHDSGFIIINTTPDKEIAITPNDPGVPLSPFRVNDSVPIHEWMHTNQSGFGLGDHDLHDSSGKDDNKSFDSRFSPSTSPPHAWQEWFTFGGLAPSRRIEVTSAYRSAPDTQPPFSSSPSSASYVSARDHLNMGLWESVDSFNWDFNGTARQYQPLLGCLMNSRHFHGEELCPICSEIVVSALMEDQEQTYSRASHRSASGAFLELYARNPAGCGTGSAAADLNLEGLVQVNSTVLPATAFEVPERHGMRIGGISDPQVVARVNLTPYVAAGVRATVTFRVRTSTDPERRLYVPGVQILNGRGARYSVEPASSTVATALANKAFDTNCAYQYWNLSTPGDGQLALSFVPN